MNGEALARAAAGLAGARFRLHGRDPATGLDCIGVLSASLSACGRRASLPKTYRLRTAAAGDADRIARGCGLHRAAGVYRAGDVLLARVGACQFHLLIALGATSFVHAHAGLRRVVRHDGPLSWPVIDHWRLPEEEPI